MINVIQTATRGNRTYQLADTPLGRVVFFEFGDGEYTQYRNLTQGDVLWTIKPTAEFRKIYAAKPIEVFASKRLTGFSRNKIAVNCGGDGVTGATRRVNTDLSLGGSRRIYFGT